jgi:hypothetical protein
MRSADDREQSAVSFEDASVLTIHYQIATDFVVQTVWRSLDLSWTASTLPVQFRGEKAPVWRSKHQPDSAMIREMHFVMRLVSFSQDIVWLIKGD